MTSITSIFESGHFVEERKDFIKEVKQYENHCYQYIRSRSG